MPVKRKKITNRIVLKRYPDFTERFMNFPDSGL